MTDRWFVNDPLHNRDGALRYGDRSPMCFNKNTWTRDFSAARGIKLLGAEEARRQGFTPKYARKGARAAPGGSTAGEKGPGTTRRP